MRVSAAFLVTQLLCGLAIAQTLVVQEDTVLIVEKGQADRRNLTKSCTEVRRDGSFTVQRLHVDIAHPNEWTGKAADGQLSSEQMRELSTLLNDRQIADAKQRAQLYLGPGFTDGEFGLVMIRHGKTMQVLSYATTFGILGSVDGTVRITDPPRKPLRSVLDWTQKNVEKSKLKFQKITSSTCMEQGAEPKASR